MALRLGTIVRRKPRTRQVPEDSTFSAEPYLRHLGQVLRAQRQAAGISTRELGRHIGMTSDAVNHVETGRESINLRKLLHACAIVGIPILWPFAPRIPAHLLTTVALLVRADAKTQEAIHAALLALDPYQILPPPKALPCE